MGQRHKHADVIIAWAEGKDVQVWDEFTNRWFDTMPGNPIFREDREFRVKPPAEKYRVALFRKFQLDEAPLVVAVNNSEVAKNYESRPDFVRWLTDWVEVDVPDELV